MKKKLFALLGCVLFLNASSIPFPASAQTLSSDTTAYYSDWKETYLRKNPYVKNEDQYYVFYGEQEYAKAHTTVEVTVSEAHGYGMLIAALMSDYDDEAKEIFDGMYRYYLAHPSSIGPHLMAWQQSDNGKALIDSNGADSATDGDLDIAYALLLADKVWGSTGDIDYLSAAKLVIGDIMEYEINPVFWLPQLGDWAHDPDQTYESVFPPGNGGAGWSTYVRSENYPFTDATRSSDFTLQYFPVFAAVTGDQHWVTVYERIMDVIRYHITNKATPLLPDFLVYNPVGIGSWNGAPQNFLEDENDGNYYYNACRTPWRIGTDALLNKRSATGTNGEAQAYAEKVTAFMKEHCGGDPKKIMAGYELTRGRPLADYSDLCFTAPLMISAAAAGDTEFHDAIRKEVLDIGVDSYFGNTIAMLCLITDDGGWLTPKTSATKLSGDVNDDGVFNTEDVVLFRNWLLTVPETHLANWEAADFRDDGRLDAADLSLMKQALLAQPKPDYVEPEVRSTYGNPFTVRDESLKLYRGPDESSGSVAIIPGGTRLNEVGYQKDNNYWVFTQYEGQYGWIRIYKEDNVTLTVTFNMMGGKPVIYLYPEQETDVHVELDLTESELYTTYPKYNSGWDVTAYPDGMLLNKADGSHHRYLFWDSVNCRTRFDYSKGFCVAGSDTEHFLKEKLTYMGLNEEEMNEFIIYWLPKLEHNAYNLIAFQGDAYTDSVKMKITPAPDSECRIFMAYIPLENPVEIEPQQLETFERKGFAVVEWGGAEILP